MPEEGDGVRDEADNEPSRAIDRRRVLKYLGIGGAAAAAWPVLAACSSNNTTAGTTTSGAAATTTTGAATTSSAAGTTSATTAASGSVGDQLRKLLNIDDKTAGKGISIDMGAVLALSGSGSYYGDTMSKGTNLAVKHIEAAGGPKINVIYKDHKSGDAAAGAQAIKDLGEAKVPIKLASYADDLGAMLAGTAQYKVLTLDGGGGTSTFAQAKDFFWGTRAITPNDTWPGLFQYVKEKMPNVKRVSVIGWDLGAAILDPIIAELKTQLSKQGLTYGTLEVAAIGNTNYDSNIQKLNDDGADMILVGIYGNDPGVFAKQFKLSGGKGQLMGFEYTPDAVKIAGPDYDGYMFTYDYYDVNLPSLSPLAKLFNDEFKKANGGDPDFYAANFYENVLAFWDLMRRVIAKGGDPKNSSLMQDELKANPTFKSLYGGDANTVGTYTLNLDNHSVAKRNMGLFTQQAGKVKALAFYGIGGEGYKVVG